MKLTEAQLRQEIRKMILKKNQNCCCQKKKLNEIDELTHNVSFESWVPGKCDLSAIGEIPGFQQIFLGKEPPKTGEEAYKKAKKIPELKDRLPNVDAEIKAFKLMLGKIILQLGNVATLVGVPSVVCYWINLAASAFAELIGIGKAYTNRRFLAKDRTNKREEEARKKEGLVGAATEALLGDGDGIIDVTIDAAKKVPLPPVKIAATVADAITEQAEIKSSVQMPAGFQNVFPEALLTGLDTDSVKEDIRNFLNIMNAIKNISTENARQGYSAIVSMSGIEPDNNLMGMLPSEGAEEIVEEFKNEVIFGRKIAIIEMIPEILNNISGLENASELESIFKDFANRLEDY